VLQFLLSAGLALLATLAGLATAAVIIHIVLKLFSKD
jgi:hypothetical protein